MTADRERQRERLSALHAEWEAAGDSEPRQLSTFLLDHGVTVELPPEPEVKPGRTGTATVYPSKELSVITRVMRMDGRKWVTPYAEGSDGITEYSDDEVTDFVPDPDPLTAEAVQEIQRIIESASFSSSELARFVGQRLLPYVAKDGPR